MPRVRSKTACLKSEEEQQQCPAHMYLSVPAPPTLDAGRLRVACPQNQVVMARPPDRANGAAEQLVWQTEPHMDKGPSAGLRQHYCRERR